MQGYDSRKDHIDSNKERQCVTKYNETKNGGDINGSVGIYINCKSDSYFIGLLGPKHHAAGRSQRCGYQ
jgi:hypothetical protein